jgi:hypothetical protein
VAGETSFDEVVADQGLIESCAAEICGQGVPELAVWDAESPGFVQRNCQSTVSAPGAALYTSPVPRQPRLPAESG